MSTKEKVIDDIITNLERQIETTEKSLKYFNEQVDFLIANGEPDYETHDLEDKISYLLYKRRYLRILRDVMEITQ